MKRKLSYERSFASSKRAINWSKKNTKKPEECSISSNKKYWFDCLSCKHEFGMALDHITNGDQWCPFCANKKLCNDDNCQLCFEKSFASHEKAIYWSEKNIKKPRDYLKSSSEKIWFKCHVCNHEFDIILYNLINDKWCPYCSHNKLCSDDICYFCFENSFASHEKSIYWSKKNIKTPRQCFKGSDKKFLFDCPLCKHEFDITLNNITTGNWCSYCANKKLCYNDNCKICFEKSFASHEKSIYWSPKNPKNPRDCFKSSHTKYLFDCNLCQNEFSIRLGDINNNNSWCPNCKHKTELKLHNFLTTSQPFPVKRQFKADWCRNPKTNRHLPFDFVIETLKIIFELDGPQHNSFVPHFHRNGLQDLIAQKDRDLYKYQKAIENGYEVYRLDQDAVLHDKIDWKSLISEIINFYS